MEIRKIVEEYWHDEESRKLDRILDHYHLWATLTVPELGRLEKHEGIRGFYEASIRRFPRLQVEILEGIEDANKGAFEWKATFEDHGGSVFILVGVNIVVIEDGRFASVRVYYDPKQLADE